jgi:hypothetical protein
MKSVRLPRPPAAISQWMSGKRRGDEILHFVQNDNLPLSPGFVRSLCSSE